MFFKAITVRQPWANAIFLGKDVENRSRYFSHRGHLLIHAATRIDESALDDPRIVALPSNELILGQLIGVVTVLDCVRVSESRWAEPSSWKLVLANARLLRHPVPWRGSLALFNVSQDALKDVLPSGLESEVAPGMLSFTTVTRDRKAD
jgi:hypothetical protein